MAGSGAGPDFDFDFDDCFGSLGDLFDPGFLEMDLDSATIEKYMDSTPPPFAPEGTKKHFRSSDDDSIPSAAPSKRRRAPEIGPIRRVDYRSNARAYVILKHKDVDYSAHFLMISALESDLERIAALRSRCNSLLIITTDWNDWARGNEERIRQVLASACPSAIKQLEGLGEWARGNDERIRQVLASQCSDAIKQLEGLGDLALGNDERIRQVVASQCPDAITLLTDNDLFHYVTHPHRKIPKKVRIPQGRLAKLIAPAAAMPDPTSGEFVGPFGASAGIPGVYPVIPKLPETASETAEV